jgi:hypothetical protein
MTIVCCGRECVQKKMTLLEKEIITNNCMLRVKYNILNLLEKKMRAKI